VTRRHAYAYKFDAYESDYQAQIERSIGFADVIIRSTLPRRRSIAWLDIEGTLAIRLVREFWMSAADPGLRIVT